MIRFASAVRAPDSTSTTSLSDDDLAHLPSTLYGPFREDLLQYRIVFMPMTVKMIKMYTFVKKNLHVIWWSVGWLISTRLSSECLTTSGTVSQDDRHTSCGHGSNTVNLF